MGWASDVMPKVDQTGSWTDSTQQGIKPSVHRTLISLIFCDSTVLTQHCNNGRIRAYHSEPHTPCLHQDTILRRAHPIFLGALVLFAFIEGCLTAWMGEYMHQAGCDTQLTRSDEVQRVSRPRRTQCSVQGE